MKKEILVNFYVKYKLFIFPILVALSSLFLIIFVIYPQISAYLAGHTSLSEEIAKSQALEVKAKELSDLDEANLKDNLHVLIAALPDDKDYVSLIGTIQGLISKDGFSLVSLVFGSGGDSSAKQSYNIKLELVGSKSNLDRLLSDMEHAPRVMKIGTFEINSPKNSSDLVNINLSLNVYYAPIPQALGSVEEPLPKLSDSEQEVITSLSQIAASSQLQATPSAALGPRGKENPFE